jgi:hypothetical protein
MGLDNPKGLPLYPRAKIGFLDRQVAIAGYRVAGRSGCPIFPSAWSQEVVGKRSQKAVVLRLCRFPLVSFLLYYKNFSMFRPSLEL